MMGLMSELHITRQGAMDTASRFWHDFNEVECPP